MEMALRNWITLIWSFIGLIIIINLLLLSYSPLPWFDEIYFTGITNSLLTNGTFHLSAFPLYDTGEILTYGPVYFFLTGLSVKLFGWGVFQFRIVNFLFALGCIFLSWRILRLYYKEKFTGILFILLYITDPMFTTNSHSGRMDSVALFFILVVIYYLYENHSLRNYLATAIAASLALLTTPRSAFFLVPVLLLHFVPLLFKLKKSQNWLKIFIFGGFTITLYAAWIFTKFGGFEQFFDYYFQQPRSGLVNKNLFASFIRFSPYIIIFEYPLVITTTLLFSALLIKKRFRLNTMTWILFLNIITFYSFILDTGQYSIFIIPCFYLLLFISVIKLGFPSKIRYSILFLILLFNIVLLTVKSYSVVADLQLRNYATVDNSVASVVPPGSKVIGNELYYYSVIKNDCEYQSIERGANLKQRIDYHYNDFDFDYLIINESYIKINRQVVDTYLKSGEFEIVSPVIQQDSDNSTTLKIARWLEMYVFYTYEGMIYKRIRRDE